MTGIHSMATLLNSKHCSLPVPPSILPGLSVLGSPEGKEVTLECIVDSYPASFIVWSLEGNTKHFHTKITVSVQITG